MLISCSVIIWKISGVPSWDFVAVSVDTILFVVSLYSRIWFN